MAAVVTWNAQPLMGAVRAEVVQGMHRVTQLVLDDTKRLVNRSQPTTRAAKSGRRRGLAPSLPGEPPKRLESRLIQSLTRQVEETPTAVIGRVGTAVIYARRLELGFSGTDSAGRNVNQAPRPFLRRALAERKDDVTPMLARGGS